MKKLLGLLGIAIASSSVICSSASAVPPPDVFKDIDGNVYVHGTTADGMDVSERMGLTGTPLTATIRAGYCGELRLSTTSSRPDIGSNWKVDGGATITGTSFPVLTGDAEPSCRGNAFSPAASNNYKDDLSRVFLVEGSYTPGIRYEVEFLDVDATRSMRKNACNFFRVSNTARNPIPDNFTIDGTAYTLASLPTAEPQLCRNNVAYTPETWD